MEKTRQEEDRLTKELIDILYDAVDGIDWAAREIEEKANDMRREARRIFRQARELETAINARENSDGKEGA